MSLVLTDRSRFRAGWGTCMRLRWLEYHSGPTGYGIRLKPQAMPLVTGILVHRVLADVLAKYQLAEVSAHPHRSAMRDDDREWIRPIITKASQDYERAVKERGFQITGAEVGTDELLYLIREQQALLEGLAWGAWKVFIPWLLAEFEIVKVEEEEEYVVACTCGLGNGVGTGADHEGRGCEGLLVMLRPDLILRHRASGVYANCDFKTGAQVKYKSWADQFQFGDVQLALGTLGAERSLGVEIPDCYIFGLHKGPRKTQKLADGTDGPRRQDSPFCYAWKRPANPPHWQEEWRFTWNYVDEQGKNRTLQGKGFDRAPIWEADLRRPAGWTNMEYVVEAVIPMEVLREQFVVLGPIPRPRHLVPRLLKALEHEELRWVHRNWAIYKALEAAGGRLDAPEVVEALDEHAPQSWECRRYKTMCSMWRVCRQETGWEDPLASGNYELRRPHHAAELEQMVARGIQPPPEQWGEDEGDE